MDFFQLNLKNTLKIKQNLAGIGKSLIVPLKIFNFFKLQDMKA